MTEPNEPDKEVEMTESSNDRALSEPKEDTAHEPKGDEEIIDLLHAAEESPVEDQNKSAAAEGNESTVDDEIIDLVNAVEPEEPAEDEPIELKEEVMDETTADDEIIDLVDDISEPVEDEGIIDLTESITDTPQEIEEIGESIVAPVDDSQAFDDISEFDDNLIEDAVDFDNELDTEGIVAGALKDDFADSLGVELDSNKDISGDIFAADKVSDEQVEAALERVIKKVFHEKIDRLLVDTIEKTVTKEIERLKKALLDDSADIEK